MHDLAIIIPHYNDTTRLHRCLEALEQQDRTGVEVVVADNGSNEDLNGVKARFAWVHFTTQPEAGAGLARNKGVEETTAPWLAFIDADCVADPDWVMQARRVSQGDPDIVTGGRVDVFDETPLPRSGAEAFEAVFAFKMRRYLEEEGFLGAGNLVVSRKAFERAGPFRGSVSEDVEWSRRAAACGLSLSYDDDLGVAHPSRSNWRELQRKWKRLTQEGWALCQGAQPHAALKWAGRALLMPGSILLHIPRILMSAELTLAERVRAVMVLIRLRLCRAVWMLRQVLGRPI